MCFGCGDAILMEIFLNRNHSWIICVLYFSLSETARIRIHVVSTCLFFLFYVRLCLCNLIVVVNTVWLVSGRVGISVQVQRVAWNWSVHCFSRFACCGCGRTREFDKNGLCLFGSSIIRRARIVNFLTTRVCFRYSVNDPNYVGISMCHVFVVVVMPPLGTRSKYLDTLLFLVNTYFAGRLCFAVIGLS